MRKAFVFTVLILTALCVVYAAEPINAVSVIVASLVNEPEPVSPFISIGFTATGFSYVASTTEDSTLITDLDLTKDGSFTFSLLTADEVNILGLYQHSAISIEIEADGFHLYEDPDPSSMEGFYLSGLAIKERNAVPISSFEPEIKIPGFAGSDENVVVEHINGKNNTIEVTFNPGKTRADLVLGTFRVDWQGKKILESGIYKADVMVSYSTL